MTYESNRDKQIQAIKTAIKMRGMSVNKAAQKANFRPTVVYEYFNGKQDELSLQTVKKLAKALDMTVSELLGETEPSGAKKIKQITVKNSESEWNSISEDASEIPNLPSDGFIIRADNNNMKHLGIGFGDKCFCSPDSPINGGDIVFVRNKDNQAILASFVNFTGKGVIVNHHPSGNTSQMAQLNIEHAEIDIIAPVIAIFKQNN